MSRPRRDHPDRVCMDCGDKLTERDVHDNRARCSACRHKAAGVRVTGNVAHCQECGKRFFSWWQWDLCQACEDALEAEVEVAA